ncbi:MAG: bifunctional phosphoribosyl-AMP cyclohydrolase/phosphoribosyl-ATP diphosphatase HisIE, partial [Candidatus Aminicenantes bacterium]|nr:bifunctional phosphoribosyl-AMP cyclohydrolase/phosphoribosyl-ATP diphosphatase HisIE [Candidatus Aminicenantes bacterium]
KIGVNIQLGMALYTGEISMPGAFIASLDWGKGVIPTVTVDESSQVLMLAYSDKDSLLKTFETGNAWYFSRSRGKLWRKGETSGNTQKFVKVRCDCDADAVLMTVKPAGPACHKGSYSCFGAKHFSLDELHSVILDRLENPLPGSYTSKLTGQMLAGKIREEAEELIEAEETADIIWEAADLLYFLTVALAKCGISYESVLNELKRRRRAGMVEIEKEKGRVS